jgi:lipopolysaccharide biosynthesis glycosyltransferase
MRIFLPELLPDLDRILYLDADTFVTGRLDELWETPLEGAPLAAVPNVVEPAMRSHIAGLGLGTGPASFFNSGVLLLNLEVMRADHSIEAVLRTARDLEGRLVWPDQDALNVAFANRWLPLHPRWNAQNSYWTWSTWAGEVVGDDALREATEDPAIRHFEGPTINKPWHYLCAHPWRGEYRRVLATTPWAGTPLVDRTAATMLIRRFPRSAQARAYLRLERCRARFKRSSITERGPGARGTSRRWRPGRRRG